VMSRLVTVDSIRNLRALLLPRWARKYTPPMSARVGEPGDALIPSGQLIGRPCHSVTRVELARFSGSAAESARA
jgi:hypothetical protein